jgi:TatA/E family protein of Tat protein translocase
MFGLGLPEILLILVIALLIFGAARLPEIGRAMGKALSEFKKGTQELSSGDKNDEKKNE